MSHYSEAQISSFPYVEDFESGSAGWTAQGANSSWELGQPNSGSLNSAASGLNAWVTNLDGNYSNNESSSVTSPLFDFTSLTSPVIKLNLWWLVESSYDGMVLQYSVNFGSSWQNVGSLDDPNNWYNDDTINGNPGGQQIGWTGWNFSDASQGWVIAINELEGLGGQQNVLLRIAFGSDGSATSVGVAFDDIVISEAPCQGIELINLQAQDETFFYNSSSNFQYEEVLDNWIALNGNAESFNCDPSELLWSYDYTVTSSDNGNLIYNFTFTATHDFGIIENTSATFTVDGFGHFTDEIYGTGETICDDVFDLNTVITGIDPNADLTDGDIISFNFSRVENFESNEGPLGAEFLATNVDFPDTGAGSYSYLFKVEVEQEVFRYAPETQSEQLFVLNDEALITLNDKTVAFEATAVNQISVCENSISIQDLTDLLVISPDPEDPETIPQNPIDLNQYWTPSTYTGPGTYVFNPSLAFPACPSNSVSINVTEYDPNEMLAIPDSAFENYLIAEGIDSNPTPDNQILRSDVCGVQSLSITSYDIENFEGLQYFEDILFFSLINNQATSIEGLDFSSNLDLFDISIINCPQVSSVNISQNIELSNLTVVTRGSIFDSIDVSNNFNLNSLELADNEIVSLDLSQNPNLEYLSIAINPITELNFSNLLQLKFLSTYESQLEVLDLSNNSMLDYLNSDGGALKSVNLNNGNNVLLTDVELNNNPDLECIFVDDVAYAESQLGWIKDNTATYVSSDTSITVDLEPENLIVTYNPNGNDAEINNWLNNNGGAIVSSCEELVWSYDLDFWQIDSFDFGDSLICNIIFIATDIYGNQITMPVVLEYFNFPVAGETDQGDGVICGKSYDLNGINGIDFESTRYDNSMVNVSGDGTVSGFDVDFPDTGAGSFEYSYSFSVTTSISIGTIDVDVSDSAGWLLENVTIPYNPGEAKVVNECDLASLSLSALFNELDVVDGTTDVNFNPDNYWFDEFGDSISTYNGPGVYTFNAEAFLPDCGGIPTTVTVLGECLTSLNLNIFLEGAYDTNTGLMRDDMRASGILPTVSPYADALNCDASVFNTTGNTAIIDWVWVELRATLDPTSVVQSRSGFLRADGSIVDVDGFSPLSIDAPTDDYYIMISHRNHLGVLTANTYTFDGTTLNVDLTTSNLLVQGANNAISNFGDGSYGLYAGDFNGDGQIQNTDRNGVVPLRGISGYNNADINLNGEVQNNDINGILTPNIGKGEQFMSRNLFAPRLQN